MFTTKTKTKFITYLYWISFFQFCTIHSSLPRSMMVRYHVGNSRTLFSAHSFVDNKTYLFHPMSHWVFYKSESVLSLRHCKKSTGLISWESFDVRFWSCAERQLQHQIRQRIICKSWKYLLDRINSRCKLVVFYWSYV